MMKVKEESGKVGLKLNIQKTKIMTSGPITSCQIDGETVTDVVFWRGSKITADGDCSHEIKRYLLLGGKVMTNLDSILKTRDITLFCFVFLINFIFKPYIIVLVLPWGWCTGTTQRHYFANKGPSSQGYGFFSGRVWM